MGENVFDELVEHVTLPFGNNFDGIASHVANKSVHVVARSDSSYGLSEEDALHRTLNSYASRLRHEAWVCFAE